MALLDKLKKDGTPLAPFSPGKPTATLVKDVIQLNKTFSKGTYQDYILDTKSAVELQRAKDLTGN